MNRLDFMKKLEELLADIQPGEREEALKYYNDYLDDAGVENEEEVLRSLGSPEKVAANIKAGLGSTESGEFTENGYRDMEKEPGNDVAVRGHHSDTVSAGRILLIILCVIFSPFLLGIGAMVFSLIVSVLCLLFALFCILAAVTFALLVSGVVFLGSGIAKLFVSPWGGLLLIGAGLVSIGLGLLFLILTVWTVRKPVPGLFRGIVDICSRLIHRKGKNGGQSA